MEVFFTDTRVNVVIGDLGVKYWSSFHADGNRAIKVLDRPHTKTKCQDTVTIRCGNDLMLFTSSSAEQHRLDFQNNTNEKINFMMQSKCVAMCFNGKLLVLMRTELDLSRAVRWLTLKQSLIIVFSQVEVWDWDEKKLTHTIPFPRKNKVYNR